MSSAAIDVFRPRFFCQRESEKIRTEQNSLVANRKRFRNTFNWNTHLVRKKSFEL